VLAPPPHVLAAFDAPEPRPLAGGQGRSWSAGDLVLKPLDLQPDELEWQADVLTNINEDGFRVAPPVRALDGSLSVDGWTAWRRVDGAHAERRWVDAIRVGERFHAAIVAFERPKFLDARTDPWSVGDKAAWGELPLERWANVEPIARLFELLRPIDEPSSLMHGDLGGNVLFADGLPPAVIDLSLYWRPPPFASAIVVGDALVWEGADASLAEEVHVQYLTRALIYRAVTQHVARGSVDRKFDSAVKIARSLAQ
jgi:uncharacterized protein (TIGR02569 family)